MKIELRGWSRETTTHQHPVIPVAQKGSKLLALTDGTPAMAWNADFSTYGKVEKLALNGSFLIQFKFDEKDLESWLSRYVQTEPEQAIKMLSRMQAQAVINLTKDLAKSAQDTP